MLIVLLAAALCGILALGRHFIIKNDTLYAVNINAEALFDPQDTKQIFDLKLKEMLDYLDSNELNTAILRFNNGKNALVSTDVFSGSYSGAEYVKNGNLLKALKRPLEKHKVQLILAVDCETLTQQEILQTVKYINKEYKPAGFLLENCGYTQEFFRQVKTEIDNYYLGVRTSEENAKQLAQNGAANLFIISDKTENYSAAYDEWKTQEFQNSKILLDYQNSGFLSNVFIMANFHNADGYILTDYTAPGADLSLIKNMLDSSAQLMQFGMSVDSAFNVTSPSKDIETYAKGIYVTGSSDPSQPLYINGVQVEQAADGTFGLYIELELGENIIEVVQGEDNIVRTVTKKEYEYTGDGSIKFDDTEKAYAGQVVQTVNPLTSILSDPDDDSRIIDGLQQGVQMVVTSSVKTQRGGKYTWAYKLSNGGYVLAKNVEWVEDEDYVPAVINTCGGYDHNNGSYSVTLGLSGKPAVISAFNDDSIVLTFLDTVMSDIYDDKWQQEDGADVLMLRIDDNSGIPFYICQDDKNLVLTIPNNTDEGFWGYNIEYNNAEPDSIQNNIISIYTKSPPHKSAGAQPLKNVSVMLDAGHGGTDPGALAVGGVNGPNEKDMNLAVSLATKDCLEKLGATVYLTRGDDTTLSLAERRELINEIKPDLFISQHHNSLEYTVDASKGAGFESYYFTSQSKSVAERMTDKVSETTGRNNRGYGYGYFYVLRNDIAPCVLNEYGFVVNPYEYSGLYSDESIYKAAISTAAAVLDVIPE